MKRKHTLTPILCLLLCLCACSHNQPSATTEPTTAASVETAQAPTTEPCTEPTTVPTTQPPRVIGPEQLEGSSIAIRDVSVEYADVLPQSVKASTTYSSCGFKEEFVLNESQVYAVIRFTLTSKTTEEIKIADIHDDFLVELIYDNRYVYSPDSDSWCFFQSGAQTAVVSDSASVGTVSLAPLSTKEVSVYIPCAKDVSENTDKYLIVVFTSQYGGYENLEFTIR